MQRLDQTRMRRVPAASRCCYSWRIEYISLISLAGKSQSRKEERGTRNENEKRGKRKEQSKRARVEYILTASPATRQDMLRYIHMYHHVARSRCATTSEERRNSP